MIQYPIRDTPGELPGMQEPIPIREWQGANTFDPLSIADSYWTDVSNLTTADYPAASVRPGYSVLGSAIGTKVLGMGIWKDTELHAVFSDGTWRKWTGSVWTTLKSGLSTTAMWSFTNFEGNFAGINLLGANGVNGLHRYDGSTVQTFGDAPGSINYLTTYQNRVWGAFGREIRACKLDDATSWNSFPGTDEDSFGKPIESIRGEDVNMLSGSPSKLTIGMPNSLHELYGGLPSDFTVRKITEQTGVANNQAALVQDSYMRFLHQTGLFEYLSGGLYPDKAFSEIIAGFTQNITANAAAGTDTEKLYFYDGSSCILMYDPRSGVQAWSVWHGIAPTCFTIFQHQLYIGDASGRVLRLGGAVDDAGTPIIWYAVTKPFTSSSISQRQRWLKLWLTVELAAGSSVQVYMSPSVSGNDWTLIQTITTSGSQRVLVPVQSFTLENTVRIKLAGTGWARIHELTRKVRLLPMK
jgi:hypothetical protein